MQLEINKKKKKLKIKDRIKGKTMHRFKTFLEDRESNPISTSKKSGNFLSTKDGAGMTKKGVAAFRAKNPGSKLQTAVTGKVKPGSKDAKRRKSFCARSKGWTGERGKAARRRWKC